MQWGGCVDESLHSTVGLICCKAYSYTLQWGGSVDLKLTQCGSVDVKLTVQWGGSVDVKLT